MIASSPEPGPGHGIETLGAAKVYEFDDSQGRYITEPVAPEIVIRTAPAALLNKILTAGTFKPIWVQLAREELARRGISPPPEA